MNKYIEKIAKAARDDSRIIPHRAESNLLYMTHPWEEGEDDSLVPKDPQTRKDLANDYGVWTANSYDDRHKTTKKGLSYGALGGAIGGSTLGAILGKLTGRTKAGIGIGALVGGLGGAVGGTMGGATKDWRIAQERGRQHEEDLKGMNRDEILAHIHKKINEYGMA